MKHQVFYFLYWQSTNHLRATDKIHSIFIVSYLYLRFINAPRKTISLLSRERARAHAVVKRHVYSTRAQWNSATDS